MVVYRGPIANNYFERTLIKRREMRSQRRQFKIRRKERLHQYLKPISTSKRLSRGRLEEFLRLNPLATSKNAKYRITRHLVAITWRYYKLFTKNLVLYNYLWLDIIIDLHSTVVFGGRLEEFLKYRQVLQFYACKHVIISALLCGILRF